MQRLRQEIDKKVESTLECIDAVAARQYTAAVVWFMPPSMIPKILVRQRQ